MTARTRLRFDSVFLRVAARLAAVLLALHFSGDRAVAKVVRAFNRLMHARFFPRYGSFATSPPAICAAWLGACGTAGGSGWVQVWSNVVVTL